MYKSWKYLLSKCEKKFKRLQKCAWKKLFPQLKKFQKFDFDHFRAYKWFLGLLTWKHEFSEKFGNFLFLENKFIGPIVFALRSLENCNFLWFFQICPFWKITIFKLLRPKTIGSMKKIPGQKSFQICQKIHLWGLEGPKNNFYDIKW